MQSCDAEGLSKTFTKPMTIYELLPWLRASPRTNRTIMRVMIFFLYFNLHTLLNKRSITPKYAICQMKISIHKEMVLMS